MNVLLIGPPGSGKGTQGARLAERLGLRHIATGDLLREEVRAGTDLGHRVSDVLDRGELVTDGLMVELVLPVVRGAVNGPGYVLDGFPRTVEQAELVRAAADDEHAAPYRVIYLDVPRAELVRRILARAQIEGRSDDTEEVVSTRERVFEEETSPLIDYYRRRGVLREVDAAQPPDRVTADILAELDA